MSSIKAFRLQSGVRALSVRNSVAKQSFSNSQARCIRKEGIEGGGGGLGGSTMGSSTQKFAMAVSAVLIGGAAFALLREPKEVAEAAGKVDPGTIAVQRSTGTPASRSP